MPKLTTEELQQRRLAKPINRELRRAGLPMPITHRCHLVTISAIPMPGWAVRMAMKGFPITSTTVVLKARRDAMEIVRLDRGRGGKPTSERFEFRRCNACGRLLVREEAGRAREWERLHPREEFLCGPDCKTT